MKQSDRSLFWIEPATMAALLATVENEPTPATAKKTLARESSIPLLPDAASPAEFALPQGALEDRLAALLDWLRERSAYKWAFVADGEGLSLADAGAPAELVASAATLGALWEKMRVTWNLPSEPSLAIDLEGGERLHVLQASSPWGQLNLGFVTRRALPRNEITRVGEAFRKALDEPTAERT